jgi:hypothetical protein
MVLGPEPPAVELGALLDRAGTFVLAYQRDFRNVMAEEHYRQTFVRPPQYDYNGIAVPSDAEQRILRSEVMIVPLAGSIPWGMFRDTFEVDGRKVRDRDSRLERLFVRPARDSVERARALLAESARYNLGKTFRNYNSPFVALPFLLSENQLRFAFSVKRRTVEDGRIVVEVGYAERVSPTVIRDLGGQGDLKARGTFAIDTETGRVLRSRMTLDHRGRFADLRVEFQAAERLGLLAPHVMHDLYQDGAGRLEGTAEYGNYRRFETGVGEITYPR